MSSIAAMTSAPADSGPAATSSAISDPTSLSPVERTGNVRHDTLSHSRPPSVLAGSVNLMQASSAGEQRCDVLTTNQSPGEPHVEIVTPMNDSTISHLERAHDRHWSHHPVCRHLVDPLREHRVSVCGEVTDTKRDWIEHVELELHGGKRRF